MDLNLRKAIKNNIAGNNEEQLQATIVDAVESGEEKDASRSWRTF